MSTSVSVSGGFYTKYKHANASFHRETFECAEETVAALLANATTSDRPGMLLGKVQSGKTRTVVCVIALAFDKMFVDSGELEVYDIMAAPTSFSQFELESKLVFVAKKQDDNLKRLRKLFHDNPLMKDKRVLI